MSDTPEYILKPDVEIEFNKETGMWYLSTTGGFVKLPDELFGLLFEPLDRQALRKQIAEHLEVYLDNHLYHEKTSELLADWILALFGLENMEDK